MRLIDADEIRKKAVPHTYGEFGYRADIRKWAVLVGDIDSAKTVDAVPVVRCPECKHHHDSGIHFCDKLGMGCPDDSEFFCKYGELKEN